MGGRVRAASYAKYGSARDVLTVGEMPDPEPGEGEVRVRLATSGVNPSDVKQRAFLIKRPVQFPVIPHSDGAGIIDKVGKGVDASRVGERVWVYNAQFMRSKGTAAEYVALPAHTAVKLPDNTDFAAGACFGIPAMTAHRAVNLFGPVEGLTFLIQGAAGAVGHYAVQFAKAKGAIVIATVSSDEKAAHARAAGADHVINYKTENVVERVREITGGKGVERLAEVEFAVNAPTYPQILARNAKVAIYGAFEDHTTFGAQLFISMQPTFQFFAVYMLDPEARKAGVDDITRMCEAGSLIHTVSARFPLDRIVAAHEAVEGGKVMGNVVVDIADLK